MNPIDIRLLVLAAVAAGFQVGLLVAIVISAKRKKSTGAAIVNQTQALAKLRKIIGGMKS